MSFFITVADMSFSSGKRAIDASSSSPDFITTIIFFTAAGSVPSAALVVTCFIPGGVQYRLAYSEPTECAAFSSLLSWLRELSVNIPLSQGFPCKESDAFDEYVYPLSMGVRVLSMFLRMGVYLCSTFTTSLFLS